MAERPQVRPCPLCGQPIAAGDGLEALGKHFERCPKTEGKGKVAKPPGGAAKE